MYGDPTRVALGALEGYTDGLRVPGTIDHVLQVIQCWFVDMGLLRSALKNLTPKPTLLIWGDRDRAVGLNSAHHLQRMLPQSSLLVLPGVGHIPFEEMPDACNQAMRDWLLTPIASELRSPVSRHQSDLAFHSLPAERGAA
jgi:pimeloyl-ACP methyl ester carboxylesterase